MDHAGADRRGALEDGGAAALTVRQFCMTGILKIKQVVSALATTAELIEKLIKSKFSFSNLGLVTQLPAVASGFLVLVTDFTEIREEFADLTPAEKAELVAYFKAELDLEADKIESVIETIASLIDGVYIAVMAVVEFFRKKK